MTLKVLGYLGLACYRSGRFEEADPLLSESMNKREEEHGPMDEDTLESMNTLATNMFRLNVPEKQKQALQQLGTVLTRREMILGESDVITITSYSKLACSLDFLGEYAEAERLYRHGLALGEMFINNHNMLTLTSMSNLGTSLFHQEKYEEAAVLDKTTLALRVSILCNDRLDTILSRGF